MTDSTPWSNHAWGVLEDLGVPKNRLPGNVLWWSHWRAEFRDTEIEAFLRSWVAEHGSFSKGPAALWNYHVPDETIEFRRRMHQRRKVRPKKPAGQSLGAILRQIGDNA